MNVQNIRLDLNKRPGVTQWVTIGQGDKSGTTIVATIYDNGVAATLTDMTARFELRMPNNTYFEDENCSISNNVITYEVDESHAALYAGGENVAYFAIYDGDTAIYSTERFNVRVARAASDGANPGSSWTNGIAEWLEDASDELDGYVADADSRIGSTINAANAAVEDMRDDVDDAVDDAQDATERAEAAIAAIDDISELAVPLMSADTRGGSTLGDGLAVDDGALHVGALAKSSTGDVYGPLAQVTAKGWATQEGTPTPSSPQEIKVARGRNLLDPAIEFDNSEFYTVNADKSVKALKADNRLWSNITEFPLSAGTYTLSWTNNGGTVAWMTSEMQASENSASTNGSVTVTLAVSGWIKVKTYNGSFPRTMTFQLELGSTPTPYVPYGCVGLEVAVTPTLYKSGYGISSSGAESANSGFKIMSAVAGGDSGMLTITDVSSGSMTRIHAYDRAGNWTSQLGVNDGSGIVAFAIPDSAEEIRFSTPNSASITFDSVTPLPLPTKGWAGALPDGTADALTIDAAGGYEWVNECAELSKAVADMNSSDNYPGWNSSGIRAIVGANLNTSITNIYANVGNVIAVNTNSANDTMFLSRDYYGLTQSEWKAQHPNLVCKFLIPLATPTTESGYITLPPILGVATVDIPELTALGFKFWVDESGSIHALAAAYEQRTLAEVAEARTQALANVAPVEGAKASTNYAQGSYLVFDGKLCKVTTAIATNETIAIGTNVTATTVAAEILAIQ